MEYIKLFSRLCGAPSLFEKSMQLYTHTSASLFFFPPQVAVGSRSGQTPVRRKMLLKSMASPCGQGGGLDHGRPGGASL